MKPRTEILQEGASILEPILAPRGFVFRITGSGHSSGGDFAYGDFVRDQWRLELHFRFSLGLVAYHHGAVALGHGPYVWAVAGRRNAGSYPGFSEEPIEAFRGLAQDLQTYCGAFLRGDAAEFASIYQDASRLADEWRKMSPFKRLSL